MKKLLSVILAVIITLSITPFVFAAGTTYYIDSISGNNENTGLSEASAWKTADNIDSLSLESGDKILFKAGGDYDCAIVLTCSGTQDNPIVISSYGEGEKPHLNTNARDAVMKLFDCSYVTVSGFEITAHNGGGIWIDTLNQTSEGIVIDNVCFTDMQNYRVTNRDDFSNGASGARAAVMVKGLPARSRYAVNDLTIKNCEVYNCGNGFIIWGSWNDKQEWWCKNEEDIDPVFNKGLLIEGCYLHEMDAEAVLVGMCDGALVTNCRAINCCQGPGTNENGDILYYTAAMWFWGSVNSTIEYCEIAGQKNVGDGMAIDFDSYSHNCTYEYIYSHDNMRFMCNNPAKGGNRGNTVRYCLSVNDNQGRNKIGVSDGEWNFSFYNNTIINSSEFQMTQIYDSLFANNIIVFKDGHKFYHMNNEMETWNNVFANNCYYNTFNLAYDKDALNTLPGFAGGDDPIKAYQLAEGSPLIGAGFEVEEGCMTDFFGNEITSNNIGCYSAYGENAELKTENFFEKSRKIYPSDI